MKIHYYKNIRLGDGSKITLTNHGVGYSVGRNGRTRSGLSSIFSPSDFGVFFARERQPKKRSTRHSGGGLLSAFFTFYAWIICAILLCCKWAVKLTALFFILMVKAGWQLLRWSCIGIAWCAEKLIDGVKRLYRYIRIQYDLHQQSPH